MTTAWASPSAKLVFVRGEGAASCPDEPELRSAVSARLGYDPFFPAASKTVVTEIERVDQGFRGKLRIVADGNVVGQRELLTHGSDCRQLVLALALAVSIALDDLDELPKKESGAEEPIDESVAGPTPTPTPSPATTTKPAPTPPPASPKPRLRASLSLGPSVAIGSAPAPAFGAGIASELRFGWFGARLDARTELPAGMDLEPRGALSTQTLAATLSGCVHSTIPFVCLGAGGGALLSRSSGITTPKTDAAALLLFSARAGARVPLSTRFYLEPSIEGGLSPLQHTVEVNGSAAHRTSFAWGSLAAHFGVHFL